ncbi:MAG: hypothetical protein AB1486_23720 [Planctomycetota bacterium]
MTPASSLDKALGTMGGLAGSAPRIRARDSVRLNEVVVGSLVDTGGYTDWYPVPNHKKNGGQLVILDTDNLPAPNKFRETVVDISNASDPPIAYGFGAGVCGIAIDDVDNDGWNEMWVTDSRGYLYLLWFDQAVAQWKCVFRSGSLGTYAGIYSKIYPYHEDPGSGQTTHLAVFTPGFQQATSCSHHFAPRGKSRFLLLARQRLGSSCETSRCRSQTTSTMATTVRRWEATAATASTWIRSKPRSRALRPKVHRVGKATHPVTRAIPPTAT